MRLDQRVLLRARPTLELFLPRDGVEDFGKVLVMDQNNAVVPLCERSLLRIAVLPQSRLEIVRHADLER